MKLVSKTGNFWHLRRNISEMVGEITTKVIGYHAVSMTLNGRTATLTHYFTLCISRFPEPAVWTWMEIDPHCHHQKDSLLSVDFSDAKVAHEFAQLIVHSSVKLQLGVRKQLFFLYFRTLQCNYIWISAKHDQSYYYSVFLTLVPI